MSTRYKGGKSPSLNLIAAMIDDGGCTPRLWSQILINFVNPQVPLTVPKDQKVVAVGIVRMLVQSEIMRKPEFASTW